MNKKIKNTTIVLIILVLLNIVNQSFYKRLDLTNEQRYTLSETTKNTVQRIEQPLFINVYLEGDFPSEFKRLQVETLQYLEELAAENSNIIIHFVNPNLQRESLIKKGMLPSQLTVEEDGKLSEAIIFPWAEIKYKNKSTIVSLLPTAIVSSQEEQLQKSVENLEYGFTNAMHRLLLGTQQKIALLSGNGELEDIYLYSFFE
ncbi:Gldg family protein [Polaribacter sp.]|nr:Gldg family protein [Polaribacter sp.]